MDDANPQLEAQASHSDVKFHLPHSSSPHESASSAKPRLFCTFCGRPGHFVEECYQFADAEGRPRPPPRQPLRRRACRTFRRSPGLQQVSSSPGASLAFLDPPYQPHHNFDPDYAAPATQSVAPAQTPMPMPKVFAPNPYTLVIQFGFPCFQSQPMLTAQAQPYAQGN